MGEKQRLSVVKAPKQQQHDWAPYVYDVLTVTTIGFTLLALHQRTMTMDSPLLISISILLLTLRIERHLWGRFKKRRK